MTNDYFGNAERDRLTVRFEASYGIDELECDLIEPLGHNMLKFLEAELHSGEYSIIRIVHEKYVVDAV